MQDTIERGMKLAADLPDIMPQQADDRLKPIYEDIQRSLRVPIVNKIFRTLANYPDYLEQVWSELRPVISSLELEQRADELRGRALMNNAPATPVLSLSNINDADRLAAFNDTIHYVLPKLLLIVTAFHEASFGDVDGSSRKALGDTVVPLGTANGTAKVELVDPANAEGQVKQLFEDIKKRQGHLLVSSYFRGLAHWPEFLASAWGELQEYVGSNDYAARRSDLIETAQSYVRDWSVPAVPIPSDKQEEVRAILAAFQLKFIPEMLLDSVLIKSLIDGKEQAMRSRFSAADGG